MLGAIAGLLGTVLVFGSYLITAASNVNSVFDFGVAVIGTVGSILVLVGSIVAFVQLRRGAARTEATSSERNALRGIAAVVTVIVVISGVATLASRDTVEDSVRAGSIEVLMKTTEFRTGTLEAKAGEMLRLGLKNDDLYIHTFTIDELSVDATVGPRGEKALTFVPSKTGTFEYKCAIPGHESMTGTLTVS